MSRSERPAGGEHSAGRTRQNSWRGLRWLRRAVQIVCLILFFVLLVGSQQDRSAGIWAGAFFRFDLLTALSASLAARAVLSLLFSALVVVIVTLLVGRVWCGWICPLGTLLE